MKHIYRQMTTGEMSTHPTTASIDKSLYLMDNLEMEVKMSEKEKQSFLNAPIQYISTMSLLVCIKGAAKVNIGLEANEMHNHDALFLKSGIICEMTDMSPDTQFFSVILDEAFYYPIFSHLDLSVLQRALMNQPICRLSDERMEECIVVYKQIKKHLLLHTDEPLNQDIIRGYLQVLLFNIYAVYLEKDQLADIKPTRQQELFNRFMELLQRDYRNHRHINHYASELCVTPSYLSKVVLAQSGHTASEHIDNFIIAEAKQLIRSRQYTILQVSEMLNFTCQSFFGRYFKKHTGLTPKEFQG